MNELDQVISEILLMLMLLYDDQINQGEIRVRQKTFGKPRDLLALY